jgi:hypothetical protein
MGKVKQPLLFDIKKDPIKKNYKTHNKHILSIRKHEMWEDNLPSADFIGLPHVFLSGAFENRSRISNTSRPTMSKSSILTGMAELLHVKNTTLLRDEIEKYIRRESYLLKKETKARRIVNPAGEDFFYAAIERGFNHFEDEYLLPGYLRERMRDSIPQTSTPMKFSGVTRFVANGTGDMNWYQDTNKALQRLLPDHPIKLLCDLFAATSIRASLESNVTKFFSALDQYYENRLRKVTVTGQGGKKVIIDSYFEKFLDATIINLNHIKNGIELGGGKKGSARKIRNFSLAMQGFIHAVVADIWITRVFDADVLYKYKGEYTSRAPSNSLYNAIEWYTRDLAKTIGFEARAVNAMMWGSIRFEEDDTKNDTKYQVPLGQRLSHGLFTDQYGSLVSTGNGIAFKQY